MTRIGAKPTFVFDMSFKSSVGSNPGKITGAAHVMASALKISGTARPYFLPHPLIENPRVSLPRGIKIFGITLFDDFILEAQREADFLNGRYRQSFVVVGGPRVNTSNNLRALGKFFPPSTILYKGDGEKEIAALTQILARSSADRPFDDAAIAALMQMRGIYVKHFGFEHWDERPNLVSPEEFETQALDLSFPELREDVERSGVSLMSSRGCKQACVFCSHQFRPQIVGWSAEKLMAETRRAVAQFSEIQNRKGKLLISFDDDTFFYDRQRVIDYFALLKKDPEIEGKILLEMMGTVNSFFHKGELDRELLNALGQAPISLINIGIDGYHDSALRYFRKGYKWERAEAVIAAIDALRIVQVNFGIVTFPSITPQELRETLANIVRMHIKYSTFAIRANFCLRAREGTPLIAKAEAEGIQFRRVGGMVIPMDLWPQDKKLQEFFANTYPKLVSEGDIRGIVERSITADSRGSSESWEKYVASLIEELRSIAGKSETVPFYLLLASPGAHNLMPFAWNLFLEELEHFFGWENVDQLLA